MDGLDELRHGSLAGLAQADADLGELLGRRDGKRFRVTFGARLVLRAALQGLRDINFVSRHFGNAG